MQILFGLWLLARLILWFAPSQGLWLAWAAELLFLALVAFELGQRVLGKRQWRNVIFLPVLLVLAIFDTAAYSSIDDPLRTTALYYGAVWMITLLIVIIGVALCPCLPGIAWASKSPRYPPGSITPPGAALHWSAY